jgi:hypothetical protein
MKCRAHQCQSPAMLQATGLQPQTLAVCPRPSCSQTLRGNRTNPLPDPHRLLPLVPTVTPTPSTSRPHVLRFATFRNGSYVYATPSSLSLIHPQSLLRCLRTPLITPPMVPSLAHNLALCRIVLQVFAHGFALLRHNGDCSLRLPMVVAIIGQLRPLRPISEA